MLTDIETAVTIIITYLVLVFASGAVILSIDKKKERRKDKEKCTKKQKNI